jgi:two-component system NtrC family sensor kinase
LILREAQRARNVVRRLLDFARQSEPHRDPADITEAVMETVMLMSHSAANQGIHITENYEPDLPWAMLDVNQFKQVVLNLLNNAMQAMPKGGRLTVATGSQVREQVQGVWLRVADTGVGIAPPNLERIFEPFFTTKPPGVGTGLGLAVSYSIVNEHGGKIEVESTVGKGTMFRVWMPCNC